MQDAERKLEISKCLRPWQSAIRICEAAEPGFRSGNSSRWLAGDFLVHFDFYILQFVKFHFWPDSD